MKQNPGLASIQKAYLSKLIASKTSVDDIMPLFTRANQIFELVKNRASKKRKKK
jgi:hypothetical protein